MLKSRNKSLGATCAETPMMVDKKGRVLTTLVGVAAVAALIEILALPSLYEGIPIPLPRSAKPIGGALFLVTFFHLLLISGAIFAFAIILKRYGVENRLAPKTKNDWIDMAMFFGLLLFGFLTWFNPLALIGLTVAGVYLAFIELK